MIHMQCGWDKTKQYAIWYYPYYHKSFGNVLKGKWYLKLNTLVHMPWNEKWLKIEDKIIFQQRLQSYYKLIAKIQAKYMAPNTF